MSLADDKVLPTGTYAIINAYHNVMIATDGEEGPLTTSSNDYGVSFSFSAC